MDFPVEYESVEKLQPLLNLFIVIIIAFSSSFRPLTPELILTTAATQEMVELVGVGHLLSSMTLGILRKLNLCSFTY